jgi:hypothetical protein
VSEQLIQLVQTRVRDLGRRVLTFEDFLAAAAAERLGVELKHTPPMRFGGLELTA